MAVSFAKVLWRWWQMESTWVRSIAGIIFTDKNHITRGTNFPITAVSTTRSAKTGKIRDAGFCSRNLTINLFFWWSVTQWRCWFLRLYMFGDRWKNEYWTSVNLYWQRKKELLPNCHILYEKISHEFARNWSRTSARWQTDYWPPEPWHDP